MTKIILSKDLNIPLNVATQKLAFIGRTGSGKTYTATKLAEEMIAQSIQIVVMDCVGIWWGLRLNADGKTPGLSIPVFGGLHGDIPLEPSSGKLIADLIVSKRISAIIDVSHFESDSDKTRFSTDFADRFYFLKKSNPSAVHIFLEECQEFIPQNIQRGEERMLHAFQRMIRLGRNFGIGASMITQRPQDVNKKALNQSECVFAFQLTGPQERKVIDGWLSDKGLDLDLASDLPKLNIGEAHVWSPSWLKISKVVKIEQKQTFNASSTPEVGKKSQSRQLASIDIEALREKMEATIERAKQEDPRELKKKITQLENQIIELNKRPIGKTEIKTKEVPVLKDSQIHKMCNAFSGLTDNMKKAIEIMNPIHESIKMVKEFERESMKPQAVLTKKPDANDWKKYIDKKTTSPDLRIPIGEIQLGKCERSILVALAQTGTCSKNKIALLSGYSMNSGGFNNSLAKLRSANYIFGSGESIGLYEAGEKAIGNYEPLPTGTQLHNYWCSNLPKAEGMILRFLINNHPKVWTKDEIALNTNYSANSGGFNNSLSKLRTLELIIRSGTSIQANENLF